MLKKNLLLALRQMKKNWSSALINIFGLSVSMAGCWLIFQYAFIQLSYDRQYSNNIYRIITKVYEGAAVRYPSAMSSVRLKEVLVERFPEVQAAGQLFTTGWFDCMLSYQSGDKLVIFNEPRLRFADQSFFSLFQQELVAGDASTALVKPYSAVLSLNKSKKYFGDEPPLGKTLHLKGSGGEHDYVVTGIMNNPALNSHLDHDVVLSANSVNNEWLMPLDNAYTYILLNPKTDKSAFEQKLQPIAEELEPPANNMRTVLALQHLPDIHLHSHLQDELRQNGDATVVYFLLGVAVIVLIIAWLNYANLAAAQTLLRTKEIGILRFTGASQFQVASQFATEAFLVNGLSLLIAVGAGCFLAPVFVQFTGVAFDEPNVSKWSIGVGAPVLLLLVFVGTCVVGFLPSRIISSLNSSSPLRGKSAFAFKGTSFRRAAVVFQFICGIVLLIAVVVFHTQFKFMQDQSLGIDISRTVIARASANIDLSYVKRLASFTNELKQLAVIQSVATSTSVPGDPFDNWTGVIQKENDKNSKDYGIYVIDPNFIPAYGLKLLAGRNFQYADFPLKKFGDKPEPVILNKTGARFLGFEQPEDAIGQTVYWGLRKDAAKCFIIGVVEDFHQESLKEPIKPYFYTVLTGPTMTLKLTQGAERNLAQTLTTISKSWKTHFPNNPFDYSFLEDDFNKQYSGDKRLALLFEFFCALALVIACMGIISLSLFSIGQRTKEVSIRKVLGASLSSLLKLLTREYLLLVTIASMISLPIAYFGVRRWLEDFAFKVPLNIAMFIVPVSVVVIIALLSVSAQAVTTILRNPVDALKHQ